MVVVLVEDVGDELDLGADGQVVDPDAGDDLTHDDHLLGRQLHRRDAEGLVRIGRPVGGRGLVAGVGVGPDLAATTQGDVLEFLAVAIGIATEIRLRGKA